MLPADTQSSIGLNHKADRRFGSAFLRLGPRRLFARPSHIMVDRDARRSQAGQQHCSYRCRIKSEFFSVRRMSFGSLQSDRKIQMLAKVFDDAVNLFLSHVCESLCFFSTPHHFKVKAAGRGQDWRRPQVIFVVVTPDQTKHRLAPCPYSNNPAN